MAAMKRSRSKFGFCVEQNMAMPSLVSCHWSRAARPVRYALSDKFTLGDSGRVLARLAARAAKCFLVMVWCGVVLEVVRLSNREAAPCRATIRTTFIVEEQGRLDRGGWHVVVSDYNASLAEVVRLDCCGDGLPYLETAEGACAGQ